jgi:ankyrin repeat protein
LLEHAFESSQLLDFVNKGNHTGNTALHIACEAKNKKLAEILINNGANIELCNNGGETFKEICTNDVEFRNFISTYFHNKLYSMQIENKTLKDENKALKEQNKTMKEQSEILKQEVSTVNVLNTSLKELNSNLEPIVKVNEKLSQHSSNTESGSIKTAIPAEKENNVNKNNCNPQMSLANTVASRTGSPVHSGRGNEGQSQLIPSKETSPIIKQCR